MIELQKDSRVVVRLPNALGDTIMATATLRRLARIVDPANITLVGLPSSIQTLEGADFFGDAIVYDRKGKDKGAKGFWRITRKIANKHADLAVILPNSLSTALMFFLARVPQRLGYFKEGRKILLTHGRQRENDAGGKFKAKYTGSYFLDLLDEINGLPVEDPHPSLALEERGEREFTGWASQAGLDRTRPLAIIVPGAAFGPSKIWIPERYAACADAFAEERNAQILISYGPGEEVIAAEVKAHMKTLPLADAKMSLRGLKSLFRRASFVLCNDTGPRHFAVAFNVPNVTIMGPNDPAFTYLASERGEVVRENVACSPCLLKVCPLEEQICMTHLTSQRVIARSLANFPR